jgi:cytochrome c oxidase cbb3-type subunit 3/ubiquinol-cytochrome c reductase cytochrome c subunit
VTSASRTGILLRAVLLVVLTGGCARAKSAIAHSPVEKGRATYARLCATCHGVAGNGYVADNAPSLRSPTFLASATDTFLQTAILRGRPGTAMGAYGRVTGGPLGPAEASEVVAFLREGGPPLESLPPSRAGDATRGQVVYEKLCQRCHGTRTQRVSAIHLANPILLATASDAFLRHAVEAGRPPTSMVPWKDALTPGQIDDVVAYLRSMAPPVPPPLPPMAPPLPPAAPRQGPIVLNPKGRAPDFALKDDLYVSIDQVKAALDGKRRLVIGDARSPGEWSSLHIAGAISTPYYDAKALDDIPNDGTWVLAYCACPHHVSGEVVAALRKRGYKHTAVIDEGVYAWQQKGYPIVAAPGSPTPPAPPPAPPRAAVVAAPAPPRAAVVAAPAPPRAAVVAAPHRTPGSAP